MYGGKFCCLLHKLEFCLEMGDDTSHLWLDFILFCFPKLFRSLYIGFAQGIVTHALKAGIVKAAVAKQWLCKHDSMATKSCDAINSWNV